MRLALRITGNVLVGLSVLGLVGLAVIVLMPESPPQAVTTTATVPGLQPWVGWLGGDPAQPPAASRPAAAAKVRQSGSSPGAPQAAAGQGMTAQISPLRPITHIEIPSIDLTADVVPAQLVSVEDGLTWQVPAFKVGHAESTAGAGQVGNAVLLGHVTSVHSGNVFADLDQVKVGDMIRIFSNEDEFDYHVVSTTSIPRTDSSLIQPTDKPTVSLITCTGIWLPTIWDYTERLVVRGEL